MIKDFSKLKLAIQSQFDLMKDSDLFVVDVDKDELWDTYLSSFPDGSNPLFRERTEHDCQCCKQFIRRLGGIVSIIDNKLVLIWDVKIEYPYQDVVDKMSELVKGKLIKDVFLSPDKKIGTDYNIQMIGEDHIRWNHFFIDLPNKFVNKDDIGTKLSEFKSGKEVFERALKEISIDSVETVIELIDQNSLYRGAENKPIIEKFLLHKKEYDKIINYVEKDNYCWLSSVKSASVARIRNSAIGTLLVDISEGVELDKAVRSFESKVAPANYKRPTAVITKKMIENAQNEVEKLGIQESLFRRHAKKEDISVNDIIFVDRDFELSGDIFDELKKDVNVNPKKLSKIEEIKIDNFIADVIPKAKKIEILVENRLESNFVNLIAPEYQDSPSILKWDNNFSWSYNGEVTDSIKERVKKAGGNINGVLRCSLSWFNYDDLDIHVIEPNKNHIYFANRQVRHHSSGMLDVDMNVHNHHSRNAVENIIWTDRNRMQEGEYHLFVNNFTPRESVDVGFEVEMEFENQITIFKYNKKVRNDVTVARFIFSKKEGIKIIESLPSEETSKSLWSLQTQTFNKVSSIMYSPNFWGDNKAGNKHYFFMIDGCKNDKPVRGFYNEFLLERFNNHRKVFEVLGSKTKVQYSDDQLCGLGFSSTQRNHIFCRVSGNFNRTLKITF